MSQPRLSLDVLNVPSPCTVPWKSMAGTDQVRFCSQCRKNVYNLSAMTAAEADDLLSGGPDTPCVRFYRRLDGTVVTTDRCGNRAARAWRRFATAVAAVFIGLASVAGCDGGRAAFCTQGVPVRSRPTTTTPPPAAEPEEDDDES